MKFALVLAAWCGAAAAEWVAVPGGRRVHKECITEAPHGTVIDAAALRRCEAGVAVGNGTGAYQTYAMSVHTDYADSVTQMNTTWNVPALPKVNRGQTVYFWPGLKGAHPVMSYPVLQPVLQFQGNGKWLLQSWYVVGFIGQAVTGPAISVEEGDVITSYMHFDPASKLWTCSGTNTRTGQSSVLHVNRVQTEFTTFHYAMLVLETVGVMGYCDLYPKEASHVTFSGVKVNDKEASWASYDYTETHCGEAMKPTAQQGGVTMTWSNERSA